MPSLIPTVAFTRPDGKLLSFELISLKNNKLEQPDDHHRHDFYSVVLIEEGKSKQTVDFKSYNLGAAQALIIPKGSVHFGHFNKELQGYYLLFTADFFDSNLNERWQNLTIFNPLYERAVIDFNKYDWENISTLVSLIKTEYNQINSAADYKILQHLWMAFLLKMDEINKASLQLKATTSDNFFQDFFYLLDSNFHKEHTVGFYASQLNITPKKLSSILSEKSGKSTGDFISDRLLLEARRMLVYSHHSVKEIAYNLGFNDPFYFSRLFKKKLGLSPEQFRSEVSQKSI